MNSLIMAFLVIGIILSHERIPTIPECDSHIMHDGFDSIHEVGSPPYEKTEINATRIDEDLPPYSLHAPHLNVKRRRKDGCDDVVYTQKSSQHENENKCEFQACQISGEENGNFVWLHNLSQIPVFVTSPTLEPLPFSPELMKSIRVNEDETNEHSTHDASKGNFTVHKILPGYAMKVFDYDKSEIYEKVRRQILRTTRNSSNEGPFDPHAIRISFAKGWSNSQGYSRSDITNCPCWIEVHLVVS